MIILYGAPFSSANRCHWMLEEVAVPYEYKLTNIRDEASRAAFLPVYPTGKIPYFVDGDVKLGESMAITLYLAERYKPELMPKDVAERALVYHWSFYAITNLQPEGLKVMAQTRFLPPDKRSPEALARATAECTRYFAALEEALAGEYLVGGRFTVADVNAGSVVNTAVSAGVEPGPRVKAWLARLQARPAFQAMMKAHQR